MFDRPKAGERAVLVHVEHTDSASLEALREFVLLSEAAGAEVLAEMRVLLRQPDPKLLIRSGKVAELKDLVRFADSELVIVNHELTPSQERNLERELECRVVDRTGLILDIFAQRARSFEGKLQVELAQLEHLSTRLVRGWTHLERQKGGIGLRGPGETQLETDRRLLRRRIEYLKERLSRVESRRLQGRRQRDKAEVPTVSLVGYTNAGKSTLFNALTAAHVYAADRLFATLDPTIRRLELDAPGDAVLADTVGFVSSLPHELVAAFRSTLQEVSEARLLLHVVDASSAERDTQIAEVEAVLAEIGAREVSQLQVYNKIDLIEGAEPRIERDERGRAIRVWMSARDGRGLGLLKQALTEFLMQEYVSGDWVLGPAEGATRAALYREGRVLAEQVTDDGGWRLRVELPRRAFDRLRRGVSDTAGRAVATG